MADTQQVQRAEKVVHLNATPVQLWPFLGATDKLNRVLGLPGVEYVPVADPRGGAKLNARTTFMGMKLEWREEPYDWAEPYFWRVKRVYTSGPIKEGIFGLDLNAPPSGGTDAKFWCEYNASGLTGRLFFPTAARQSLDKAVAAAKAADDAILSNAPLPHLHAVQGLTIDRAALASGMARWLDLGVGKELAERLKSEIETLPDEELSRMRPFEVAERWGFERMEVLVAFMRAVRAGLLDLTWQVICPHCRGASSGAGSLKQIRNRSRCDFCNVDFDTEFDRSVEARFTVNPAVRVVADKIYCIGGPGRTPHIPTQFRVEPGQRRTIKVDLKAAAYRLRATQFLATAPLVAGGGGAIAPVEIEAGDSACNASISRVLPGPVTLQVHNSATGPIDLKLEQSEWSDIPATGTTVTSLPEFQDMASKDLLLPDDDLAVKSVTLVFSDLRGSTSLYRLVGDAAAYALVREHFRVMEKVIQTNRGGVVKTIGDAVMAVFISLPAALRCCFEIQREFVELWKRRPDTACIVVKLGFHCGPCIAVNLNNRIDYFGTTANVAARIQNESKGGDIVFMRTFLDDDAVQKVLKDYVFDVQEYEAELRGIDGNARLVRLTPHWDGKVLPQGTVRMERM